MPPLPEFRNGSSLIGRIKIHGKLQMKHHADPACHVTITAKVKIKLKGIPDHDKQCLRRI